MERGGVYAGTCAGAYFASRELRWHGEALGAESGYSLGFFPGTAVGPIYGLADYPNWAWSHLNADGLPHVSAWYAAGPWFDVPEGKSTVVAKYDIPGLPEDGKPAVVSVPVGEGEAVLWGPHPEGNPNLSSDEWQPPEVFALYGATLREAVDRVASRDSP